ncbi:MAG: ATP-dependent zinc metalloprotease FtsH [Gemmataceae bacterium]
MSKRGRERWGPWLGALALAVGALLAAASLWLQFQREPGTTPLRYGDLVQTLRASSRGDGGVRLQKVQVGHADVRGEVVTTDRVSTGDGERSDTRTVPFRTLRVGFERDQEIYALLRDSAGIAYQGAEDDTGLRALSNVLMNLLFLGLMVGTVVLMLWWKGGGSPFSFGRSRARVYAQKDVPITFRDVAGIDEAVAELREVVDFLKYPEKYQALGGRIPKGVLLVGPPGTGKTLLARAVAGEAHVPFFSLSGSDFVEMFVGVGAARVRDLFNQAESKAPCIVFIDELDALGKTRAGATIGGHDEREQTLNQLLVEMDGFDVNRGVILMGATNRPETVDAALLRPGRFDRTVVVDRPDINGREAILRVHIRDVRLGDNVDLRRVASLTPGMVGADLANLVNEAALLAARAGKADVMMADFEEAIERGAVGLERKSRIMNAEEKQRVAYHEAGHALVACLLPNTHPVHKITIIPRGVGNLGYVLSRPDEDRYLVTRSELLSKIKVALGGTVAEELVFQEVTSGATSDLEKASDIARRMVTQFGMSRLGRVSYHDASGPGYLAGQYGGEGERYHSPETAREIDLEVRAIIDEATAVVRDLLGHSRATLETIARKLIEKEVIDGRELREILHLPLNGVVPEPAIALAPAGENPVEGQNPRNGTCLPPH